NNEQGSFEIGLKGHESLLEQHHWQMLPNDPEDVAEDRDTIRLQTRLADLGLVLTKTYTLQKNSYTPDMDVEIKNVSDKQSTVAYRLGGPRGLVLEGAWYATKKREVAIADGFEARLNRHTV